MSKRTAIGFIVFWLLCLLAILLVGCSTSLEAYREADSVTRVAETGSYALFEYRTDDMICLVAENKQWVTAPLAISCVPTRSK